MKRYEEVAAYILCGGASSRMGRDKALLELGGSPLIVRTARVVEPLVASVCLVGGSRDRDALGLEWIPDREFNGGGERVEGPLAGILTALVASSRPWNLILACDLPYLNTEWVDWMLSRATGSRAELVAPQISKGLQPLAAVYRRECLPALMAAAGRGTRKVTDAVAELRKEVISSSEWRAKDPQVLGNMNCPADYEEARRWWEAQSESANQTAKKD